MKITAVDEPIHAGWLTIELESAADVETFNSCEYRHKIDQVFRDKEYEAPRFDDDARLPYLDVDEKDGTVYVTYSEDGWCETARAALPASVSIWSYDVSAIDLTPHEAE